MTPISPTKTVALYGGSFNPPHEGHLSMASYVQKTLAVDETWMLFSQNPFKDAVVYPDVKHRINMATILAKNYDANLVMTDIEDEIAAETGHHETFFILNGLQQRFPTTKFVFVMGADSFARFHTWKERDDILNGYIVAVVDRPGYHDEAVNCRTAVEFADQAIDITDPDNLKNATHGWCYLNNPTIDMSSSGIIRQLAEGKTDFQGPFAEVADYIYEHGLYGTAVRICPTLAIGAMI